MPQPRELNPGVSIQVSEMRGQGGEATDKTGAAPLPRQTQAVSSVSVVGSFSLPPAVWLGSGFWLLSGLSRWPVTAVMCGGGRGTKETLASPDTLVTQTPIDGMSL